MAVEWRRDATEQLIQSYKKHPVLYDMRHPRYYNKTFRGKALSEIVDDVQQVRPDTSMKDVLRKIQTMRTQFGQELTKTRRHSMNGSMYQPTVWWYESLSFLQNHIKHRSVDAVPTMENDGWKSEHDDSSSYNVSIVRNRGDSGSPSEINNVEYEHSTDGMEYETEVHYEINSIDMKDIKALELKPIVSASVSAGSKRDARYLDRSDRKVARTSQVSLKDAKIVNHHSPTPESVPAEPATATVVELKPVASMSDNIAFPTVSLSNARHVSLGNFVASQMACIKDDFQFYETQMEILNIINRGILRQLAVDKKNARIAEEAGKEKRDGRE
uniref:MADF domain-containing protein n=1 Tax=Anopheles quadriannulatus TaxID=34691 RepID=A0A182XJ44_ANOQN